MTGESSATGQAGGEAEVEASEALRLGPIIHKKREQKARYSYILI